MYYSRIAHHKRVAIILKARDGGEQNKFNNAKLILSSGNMNFGMEAKFFIISVKSIRAVNFFQLLKFCFKKA